jgi:GNAT superfamily N-acetyltransferase
MESTIREFQPEDVEQIIELGSMMHKEGAYSFLPFSKAKLRELGKTLQRWDYGNCWVAVDNKDGKIIGLYVAIIIEYWFCYEKICQDYALYIHPDYRKKNSTIAIRLIKKAEEWARERGAKEFCPVSSMAMSSGRLEKLYNFMKFETVGHIFKKRL